MAEFLLELRSEEIPARMQPRAVADLERLAAGKLEAAGLAYESIAAYATPRRLTLAVDGLPERQPDFEEERKGPKVAGSDPALEGFVRSIGAENLDAGSLRSLEVDGPPLKVMQRSRDQIEETVEVSARSAEKGEFFFVKTEVKGRPTIDVLRNHIGEILFNFPWPKSMRWAYGDVRWVRPIHNLLAVFNGSRLDHTFSLVSAEHLNILEHLSQDKIQEHQISTTHYTFGHRFLCPGRIEVRNFREYRGKLRKACVVLDPEERKEIIRRDSAAKAAKEGMKVKPDEALVAENAAMVEWPVVLMGRIDQAFMGLHQDILTTVMRHHLKQFALIDRDGNLAPAFLLVADNEAVDGGEQIIAGNERVLRARLADAKFFWDQDIKQPLGSYLPRLDGLIFHRQLGTVGDKVRRLEPLADIIASYLPAANPKLVRKAARLCKADLVTQMVGEFPELQGVMGARYAYFGPSQADAVVATAIREHYSPVGPKDRCPTDPVSVAVALADRIDTLVGFFSVGERPTGSKDPYALRRAALGVIRLVVENEYRIPLCDIFSHAHSLLAELPKCVIGERDKVVNNLLDFLADRLKVVLRDRGVRHDLIAAVFAVERPEGGPEDDLVRLLARVEALRGFLESDDGANLLTAYRRAANIVRIEEQKDKTSYREVKPKLFQDEAENILWKNLSSVQNSIQYALRHEAFEVAMKGLSQLRLPIDRFFERVLVNTKDRRVRANRLALLRSIVVVTNEIADFSKIEG